MNSPSAPPPPPEMSVYRRHTITLLRRYFNMSVELGRLPNILGREFFRTNVHNHDAWFEDSVVFVHDVERCLQSLQPVDQLIIARCIFQEYTHEEAARLLRCAKRTVEYRLPDALDALTVLFLERRLLIIEKSRLKAPAPAAEKPSADDAPPAPAHDLAPVGDIARLDAGAPICDVAPASTRPSEEDLAPEPGIIPDLQACGNLFVKPPAEAFSG